MKFADLHTHTKLCRHAGGEPEKYLEKAVERGLSWYGISDHFPSPEGYDAMFRMSKADFPVYRDIVRRMQDLGRKKGIKVLYAVEYDYVPGHMNEVIDLLNRDDFDYVIGSVHFVGGINGLAFDDPDKLDEIRAYGLMRLWKEYYECLRDFTANYPMQILGHCDLVKKYLSRCPDDAVMKKAMTEIFQICADRHIMIELNTAGLRKPIQEIYPSLDVLKLARKAGAEITFGSDAHAPAEVARDFDQAAALAKAAGYTSCWTFEKKHPVELPFD